MYGGTEEAPLLFPGDLDLVVGDVKGLDHSLEAK